MAPLNPAGTGRRRSWWRAWLKEERRTPIRRRSLNRGLLLCLLLLSPLLALHVQRRSQEALREHQAQRDDTLALMEASLSTAERNARDWGHWNDAYRFARGANPGYPETMEASSIFTGGTIQVMLRPDGSTLMVHAAPAFRPASSASLERCVQDNRQRLQAISSVVRLACRSADGALYLGAATLISDDTATAPAAGTLAMLEPLQKQEYTPRIRQRLATLSQSLTVMPPAASTAARGVERVQPLIHADGDTVLGLRKEAVLPVVLGSLGRDLPLLLAVPALALLLRILALLERRRLRLRERQVERRASQRIRRTCAKLDALMASLLPSRVEDGALEPKAVLGQLSAGEPEATADTLSGSPADESAAGRQLEQLGRRFETFLGRASQLALTDALTQLPNRRYFIEQLAASVGGGKAEALALLFIDIDRFKVINDTYGHSVGDAVLISVSERLRQVLQPGDFMARYGGDELAVILDLSQAPDPSREGLNQAARQRAEAMIARLREPVQVGDLAIAVSLSIGITLADPGEQEISGLIQRSDLAMYQAKRSRSSRIIGPGEVLEIPQLSSYHLYNDLIEALAHRRLEVFFQPVCSAEGRWRGLEALARWQHPDRGWIGPDVFMELAELHRQMKPLGEELIRLSLAGFRQLLALDSGLILYLNLSPSQLLDPELAETLLAALAGEGLQPAQLVLELTEHAILEPNSCVERNLALLRSSGCRLALDDFGSGYSSLVLLLSLRPDLVKIDRTFTQAMRSDSDAGHIVALIAQLAPQLGLELVAEGIEDRAFLPELTALGVERFQGYALGRPAPAETWLAAARPDQSEASSRSIV